MSDNKIMIKFYAFIFIVCVFLTYIVDLNEQIHFVKLDSSFISNSFCFAILSGILTGVIVALLIEIRQYLLHKSIDDVEWLPADITLIEKIRERL